MASCQGRQKRTVPPHHPAVGRFAFTAFVIGLLVVLTGLALTDDLRAQDSGWVNVMDGPGDKRGSSGPAPAFNDGGWNDVISSTPEPRPEPIQPPTPRESPEPVQESSPETRTETKTEAAAPAEAPDPKPSADSILAQIDKLLAANLPDEIPPPLYINNLCMVQYAGAVSMAYEGMRIVYGQMNEKEEELFKARWQPLFQYPNAEVVSYLNQLLPLLVQYLSLRASLNDSIQSFNATQMTIFGASQTGDAYLVVEAMEDAALYTAVMKILERRLTLVTEKILALGGPPDAGAMMKKARQKHEEAFKEFAPKTPLISITPAKLNAVAGKEYLFTVKIKDYKSLKNKDKLSIKWFFEDFGPGWGKPENGLYTIKRIFSDKKVNQHKLTVNLQQYPGPKTLASLSAEIKMVEDPGCWVLTSIKTVKASGEGAPNSDNAILTQNINPEKGWAETTLRLPEMVAGKFDRLQYLHSWQLPPKRLIPGQALYLDGSVKRQFKFPDNELAYPTSSLDRNKFKAYYRGETLEKNTKIGGSFTQICVGDTSGGGQSAKLAAAGRESRAKIFCGKVVTYKYAEKLKEFKQLAQVKVTFGNKFFYHTDSSGSNTSYGPEGEVIYTYEWDPTGEKLKPLDCGSGTAVAGGEPADSDADTSQEDLESKIDKIRFHQNNIKYFDTNIESLKKRLQEEKDPDARSNLTRDLLYAEDARQREIDAVTSINTGEFVRTRTALDNLNLQIMAEQSRKQADECRKIANKWHKLNRIRQRGQKLIDLAPVGEREELRKFLQRHQKKDYSIEDVANGEADKLSRAIGAVANRVIGACEAEAQAHLEDADFWNTRLEEAQNVKTFCDYYLMALSLAAPLPFPLTAGPAPLITASGAVHMGYGAVTGYIEGGRDECIRRTLSCYNTITIVVDAGMRGFHDGVINHLEEYARNPEKVKLDETRAGAEGAAWSAGTAAVFAAAIKFGMSKYNAQRIKQQKLKIDNMRQAARQRYHRQRYAEADAKIKVFEQRVESLSNAGRSGASKAEILKLRNEMDGVYRDLKNDWFAKMRMKAIARNADFRGNQQAAWNHKLVSHYNAADRRYSAKLKERFAERMQQAGFTDEVKYKLYSNSASQGGVGMDVDLGVDPPPQYKMENGELVLVDGKPVVSQEYKDWLRNLSRTVDGKKSRISLIGLQAEGEKQMAEAFRDVYGQKPGEAMVNFTTSYSPDAYKDVAWLQGSSSVAYRTDPQWTAQAAEVTNFKVNSMRRDHPSLGYYGAMQENSRGLVKDFDTKMTPLLGKAKNPEAVRHMTELRNTMEMFVNNEIGPVEAERRLRLLTGNSEGVIEVARRFGVMLQGLR